MSQVPGDPLDPIDQPEQEGPPPVLPRRSASATLRDTGNQAELLASMDPAQRSLAEALRTTFVLLQVGMLALMALFLFSGMRQVREAERGVRLTFGRITEQDIPPGLHFSWPFPIGEFVTIETGLATSEIDDSYWPRLNTSQRNVPLDKNFLVTSQGLKPGEDGGLLTGDGNIAHTQWSIQYRRTDPAAFLRNVNQPDERKLVISAVQRGIVRVFAEQPIDALLRQGTVARPAEEAATNTPATGAEGAPAPGASTDAAAPPPPAPAGPKPSGRPNAAGAAQTPAAAPAQGETTLGSRIRRVAQETLDHIGAGITIDQVVMKNFTPPLPVRESFNKVQSTQSQAAKGVEEAERQKRERLNAVAGRAHPALLERIGAYERAIESSADAEADRILAQIDALLEGEPVEINGAKVEKLVSGEVTDVIGRARNYRTEVVSKARTAVESFAAKLDQYRRNPAVLISREWTDAYLGFFDLPTSQVMMLPPDAKVDLWLNSDPDFQKRQEEERNKEQIQGALKEREQQRQRMLRENRDAREAANKPGGVKP